MSTCQLFQCCKYFFAKIKKKKAGFAGIELISKPNFIDSSSQCVCKFPGLYIFTRNRNKFVLEGAALSLY